MNHGPEQSWIVSFCVIAYNEEALLPSLLEDLLRQTYSRKDTEIILVDGESGDRTRQIMEDFFSCGHGYRRVAICDNPKRTQPCGWNIAIAEAKGDILLRVDAHASIPPDFIEKNVACIASGQDVCGGSRPNIIDKDTPWKHTLLMAESSMFGSGIAPYRRNPARCEVKSIFHGAYRREVFERVGGFDEKLTRTEDNEIHYRIRKAGYRICFDPQIVSYQHTRSSLPKMLRQKYLNGYWIGRTVWICPACLELYHFVPFCFILAIIFTSALALAGLPLMAVLMWGAYVCLAVLMTVCTVIQNREFHAASLALPLLFLLLHTGYGLGTLAGLLSMPVWKRKITV